MLMEGPREPSELVVIHHQKRCCGRMTFNLESDQSLPLELAKHDPFGRPEVVFGVCIALRDLVHPFSPKVASLDLEGGQNRGFDGAS